ncbi:hypothetical protein [Faecalibacterium prausnitzii]|uniref:hypothetical protein n=1 Tax=Faecalibacterium prausnitzii TaxID=853 RepID=UPI00290BF036|nr:hypothetical protein [Faecalibacterium prausnitzii]MDU8667059.1 hypothetical protein [Faecalibacterium prausnitzii]
MKMAKKFLAVALAGVLALSVLTGCGNSVKSKDIAKALTKMGVKVEQSDEMDKTAKSTLTAIEAIVNEPTNAAKPDTDTSKITLENAVDGHYGKVIMDNTIADSTDAVKKALGMMATGTAAETANKENLVRVALVNIENAKKDASLQAHFVKEGLVRPRIFATTGKTVVEPSKLGTAKTKDGKYMLVVIVNDVVAKA